MTISGGFLLRLNLPHTLRVILQKFFFTDVHRSRHKIDIVNETIIVYK